MIGLIFSIRIPLWVLLIVPPMLLGLATIAAMRYVWLHHLGGDWLFFSEPISWSGRKLLSWLFGVPVVSFDSIAISRQPSLTLTVQGLAMPNPEPPPGLEGWREANLLTAREVVVDFGSWREVLSLVGVFRQDELVLGSLYGQIHALHVADLSVRVEEVDMSSSRADVFAACEGLAGATESVAFGLQRTSNLKMLTSFATLEAWVEAAEARHAAGSDAAEVAAEEGSPAGSVGAAAKVSAALRGQPHRRPFP